MESQTASAILRPEALMRAAEAETGLSDWGAPPFEEALEILCRSARDEARLDGPVLAAFAGNIRRLMGNRLRLYADRRNHPRIQAEEIVSPLIVIGLPRSGTTILHSLLSQDPAARSPLKWEVDNPSPPPRRETYATDPRIAVSAAAVAQLDPQFRAMHQVEATLPEECNSIMTLAFQSLNFWASTPLPSYADWLLERSDMRGAYALHRDVLQHLQAFAPGSHWVLKAPPHLLALDALLETYPDARIVVTHRDPAAVLPSNASLIAFLRKKANGTADPLVVGEEQMRVWGTAVRRGMAYRATHPDKDRFFDTQYSDFVDAPLDTVTAIYAHFGMPLDREAEAAMTAFMRENRQDKHGRHDYTAETYGMAPDRLRRAFGDYIDQYAIRTA